MKRPITCTHVVLKASYLFVNFASRKNAKILLSRSTWTGKRNDRLVQLDSIDKKITTQINEHTMRGSANGAQDTREKEKVRA